MINAYRVSEIVLVWSPANYENDTERLAGHIWENSNSVPVRSLGILGAIIHFYGRLQDYVMCDVVLLFTLSLYQATMNFMRKVETETSHLETEREEIWTQYGYMKSLTNQINELFDRIIMLLHIYNALNISYFLLQGFSKEERRVGTILLGVTAVKVTLIYLVATKISYQVSYLMHHFNKIT